MTTILHPSKKFPLLSDVALLLARVALGVILIAHGWQKFNEWTLSGTAQSFDDMGAPAPDVSSASAAGAELIGGTLLVVGLLTPIVAVVNIVVMLDAFAIVHVEAGVFVEDGGFELVIAIAAGLTLLAVRGAGRFRLDALISRSSRRMPQQGATTASQRERVGPPA